MANKLYNETAIQDIAVAIREKNGSSDTYTVSQMGDAIRGISVGSSVSLQEEKTVDVFENGQTTVEPDSGYDGLKKVIINTTVHQNFCSVKFYNDDRTTLLYEVLVPYGSSAVYAGEAPTTTQTEGNWIFSRFEPSPSNVTEDMSCYAIYEAQNDLNSMSWAEISAISEAGTAADYFAVGDMKAVPINGTIIDKEFNENYYAYILGIDHNSTIEGTGIHFGTFKTAEGKDIALIKGYNGVYNSGLMNFAMSAWGGWNYGGWAGCDMRYAILGSTDVAPSNYGTTPNNTRTGYDATETCATNPVAKTLMAALPADLRAVMKPMTKYTDNKGNASTFTTNVTATIDYLPLLSLTEVFGPDDSTSLYYENPAEPQKQAQYAYFAAGNSVVKMRSDDPAYGADCWSRTVSTKNQTSFCIMRPTGAGQNTANSGQGIAPIFKV